MSVHMNLFLPLMQENAALPMQASPHHGGGSTPKEPTVMGHVGCQVPAIWGSLRT